MFVGLCFIAGRPAVAQDEDSAGTTRRRHGLWLSSGIGAGWGLLRNSDDGGGRGLSGYWRMGGTPSDQLRLGAEFSYCWQRRTGGLMTHSGNVMGVAQYYPLDGIGAFVKGGLGLSMASEEWELLPGQIVVDESLGVGLTAGTGIDIPLFWVVSATPNVDWLGARGLSGDSGSFSLFSLTLGVTFRAR